MENLSIYCTLVALIALTVSALTSARIAAVLAKRWKMDKSTVGWFMAFAAACSVYVVGNFVLYAVHTGGAIWGLGMVAGGVIITAGLWIHLIGGIKVIERMLENLEQRLS